MAYLHADHLGSVSVASGAGAALLSRQAFGPWGTVTSGGVSQTALNFTGQRLDSGTGLLYYHARMYDPALARFVRADTIVPGQSDHAGTPNPQSLNRYAYVGNNPVTITDPTGHCPWCIAGAAVGAVVGVGIYAYNHQDDFNGWDAAGAALEGGLVGATAVIFAPALITAAAEVVTGIGVATGSTSLVGGGIALGGAATAATNLIYPVIDQGQMASEEVGFLQGVAEEHNCSFTVCGSRSETDLGKLNRQLALKQYGEKNDAPVYGIEAWRNTAPTGKSELDYYTPPGTDLPFGARAALQTRYDELDNWNEFPKPRAPGGIVFQPGKVPTRNYKEPWQ